MKKPQKANSSVLSSGQVLELLRRYECRNVTYIAPDGSWPIVWAKARGWTVWDPEGTRYVDLTAAFGVAATGHANPRVCRAAARQLRLLPHAMGDVHPHPLKALLARELSGLTYERWTNGSLHGKTIFTNSGFEAVEAALKTAFLATGKERVIAFDGAYHGLGYGALNATHRPFFRWPFRKQLRQFADFVPFPTTQQMSESVLNRIEALIKGGGIGAILIEPIQGRGGIRVAAPGFLRSLAELCQRTGTILILDEIYTGFGRTGYWFACEHEGVVPDLICVGKALTGGFPLSACVGRADLMDQAWPPSQGEAIHTSTFLGNPIGCAMALAQIEELRRRRLVERAGRVGQILLRELNRVKKLWRGRLEIRGRGLMVGLAMFYEDGTPATDVVLKLTRQLLCRGFIVLPEGDAAEVLAITPPLTIPLQLLKDFVGSLCQEIELVNKER